MLSATFTYPALDLLQDIETKEKETKKSGLKYLQFPSVFLALNLCELMEIGRERGSGGSRTSNLSSSTAISCNILPSLLTSPSYGFLVFLMGEILVMFI